MSSLAPVQDIRWGWSRPRAAALIPEPVDSFGLWDGTEESFPQGLRDRWVGWTSGREPPRKTEGLLDEFIGLARQPDAAILRFVKRWGPLRICRHLLPAGHSEECVPLGPHGLDGAEVESRGRSQPSEWEYWEPVEAIRHYARQFRSVLAVAANLSQGRPGERGDWVTIADWSGSPSHEPDQVAARVPDAAIGWSQDYERPQERDTIAEVVSLLLRISERRQRLVWTKANPILQPSSGTYGELALQLAAAVTSEHLATCSNCGQVYAPPRRPRADQANYCIDCRDARRVTYRRKQAQKEDN